MNKHETAQTKPSPMEQLKDKASNLVHKVADKMHGRDETPYQTTLNTAPDTQQYHNAADPRREKGEGAAGPYQPQSQQQPHLHHQHQKQHLGGTSALGGGPSSTQGSGPSSALGGGPSALGGPVTDTRGPSGYHPAEEGLAAAGPTGGNTRVPTYAHNVAPTTGAAGAAGGAGATSHTAYLPEQTNDTKRQEAFGLPVNTNNSTTPVNAQNLHQSAPVHSVNAATSVPPPLPPKDSISNTAVPAMGAPGTTTAAGTHIPSEYNPGSAAVTAACSRPKPTEGQGQGQGPVNTVPAMGAPDTTTAAGTHIPGEYNPGLSGARLPNNHPSAL